MVASNAPVPQPPAPLAAAAPDDAVAELAFELEFDQERIFRFVADEIRYEPYIGILRGATGTLETGAGNSVDKALLLAALHGVKSRIPHDRACAEGNEAERHHQVFRHTSHLTNRGRLAYGGQSGEGLLAPAARRGVGV